MSVTVTMVKITHCCPINLTIFVQEPLATQWMENVSAILAMQATGAKTIALKDTLEKDVTNLVNVNLKIISVILHVAVCVNRDTEVRFKGLDNITQMGKTTNYRHFIVYISSNYRQQLFNSPPQRRCWSVWFSFWRHLCHCFDCHHDSPCHFPQTKIQKVENWKRPLHCQFRNRYVLTNIWKWNGLT